MINLEPFLSLHYSQYRRDEFTRWGGSQKCSPPPTALTVGVGWPCGAAVGSSCQYKWRPRGDFWISLLYPRGGAPMGRRSATPADKKIKKNFFFKFQIFCNWCTGGMLHLLENHVSDQDLLFFLGFTAIQDYYSFSHFTRFLINQDKKHKILVGKRVFQWKTHRLWYAIEKNRN